MENQEDARELRLLSIFYYVMAGLQGLITLLPAIYIVLGVFFLTGEIESTGSGSPEDEEALAVMGGVFIALGVFVTLLSLAATLLSFMTARALGERRSPTLIYITAGLACLSVPIGTALGVFTFVVMARPSVKELFRR